MTMATFDANGAANTGYLALPPGGSGRGVLVLHAWWGLTDFFKSVADRLAAQGFVAFAPDLMQGQTASTPEAAQHLVETREGLATKATAEAALEFLRSHPAVEAGPEPSPDPALKGAAARAPGSGDLGRPPLGLAAVGFSFGAAYAILLDSLHPGAMDRIVLFYGGSDMDLAATQARIQGHFAETDPYEPLEGVKKINLPNVEVHIYPGTGHWFVEENRPQEYNAAAAALAWQRTFKFLGQPT
jgi:carboxymethylenebutenolidase